MTALRYVFTRRRSNSLYEHATRMRACSRASNRGLRGLRGLNQLASASLLEIGACERSQISL